MCNYRMKTFLFNEMGDLKIKICRLCLNVIESEVYEIIRDAPNNVFNTLLLKLNLDDDANHLMCSTCSKKLYAAFEFKSTCLFNDSRIVSTMVDLKEIYLKEEGKGQSTDELNKREICRLCTKLTFGDFTPLQDVDADTVKRYIPELNFEVVEDPVICKPCLHSLVAHSSFIKECLDVEGTVKNYFSVQDADSRRNELSPDLCLTNIKSEYEKDDRFEDESMKRDSDIKTEEVELSSDEHFIKSEIRGINDERAESPNYLEKLEEACRSNLHEKRPEAAVVHMSLQKSPTERSSFECNLCDFKVKHKRSWERHLLTHKDRWYKCDLCEFKVKHKGTWKRHELVHKSPSEIQWFKCDLCDYKTKYKGHMKPHMVVHKAPTEIEWFECTSCDYKAKRKTLLTAHTLLHKSPSEIQWYECNSCGYKARYKGHLTRHMAEHKNHKTQWHECSLCRYRTKQERLLERHVLKHKTSLFECDLCDYKANRKVIWERHKSSHQDGSNVKWYQCSSCDHKTKWKESLKVHMLMHKSPSDIQWYRCDLCVFKVKHKKSLERHQLVHKSPLEINWFVCTLCDYKAKHKTNLDRHLRLTHRDPNGIL